MEEELSRDKESGQGFELPLDYCPVCSKKLESRRCKMVCDRCGYFMSCSEFE
ncbi:MAG TPA: hypothetical protein VFM21_02160 [Terriglobia bacterium]|nr:hypothetical protein [Terriglobia bacterium]